MPTVLFADAHRQTRAVSAWLLDSYGFKVDSAGAGLECPVKLRRFVPDWLMLDLELPWSGEGSVLAVRREDPRLLPTRVVLPSAVASAPVLDGLACPPSGVRRRPGYVPLGACLTIRRFG